MLSIDNEAFVGTMSLENQISQTANPQRFTDLCNAVHTAEYGAGFQVIDGTRSDLGNDGYIIEEERVVAIYCPIKPERQTDAKYFEKLSSDLQKAVKLRDSGKYRISRWTFMTPRKLSAELISKMVALAAQSGLRANHLESTYLADRLLRYRHLLDEFPEYYGSSLSSEVSKIRSLLEGLEKSGKLGERTLSSENFYGGATEDDEELDRVIELRRTPMAGESRTGLREIYYASTDDTVRINALLGILDYFDAESDNAGSLIELCDEGNQVAARIASPGLQAYFLAKKGYFISYCFSELNFRNTADLMMDSRIGIATVSEEHLIDVSGRFSQLESEYRNCFQSALDMIVDAGDRDLLAAILIIIGNAAGLRATLSRTFGPKHIHDQDVALAKRALIEAKDISASANDGLGIAHAIFNLANQIRFFGEQREALLLAVRSLGLAKKHDDEYLVSQIEILISQIRAENKK